MDSAQAQAKPTRVCIVYDFISNRYVPMTPIISHVSLDKDYFSCFVLLVLKAGFPSRTRVLLLGCRLYL